VSARSLVIVALALVFGLSAAAGVNMLISGNRSDAAKVETVPVVVAAMDIPRGGTVTSEQVRIWDCPAGQAPPGAIAKLSDAIDRAVYTPLVKGEPVLDGKLAPKGAGRGLAALIPVGMRAFTIQTPNVASGVAGFIMPGNKVDVLMSMSDSGDNQTGGGSTTTLLQNVEILAVDQRIDAPADNKVDPVQLRSVTLLVTPNQAAKIDLGQNKGTLHLSLRNLGDGQFARTAPATMNDLRFHQERPWDARAKDVLAALGQALAKRKEVPPPPAPAPPPAPIPIKIRTIRGNQEGLVSIQPIDRQSESR
jgi:pilus assembly protein CpaB